MTIAGHRSATPAIRTAPEELLPIMKHLGSLGLLLCVACSSTPPARVPLPPQDVEISSPHVSRIYVLDAPELTEGLHEVRVEADEQPVGVLENGSYLCWEREPGSCLIAVKFEEMEPPESSEVTDWVDADLEAGQVYFYGLTLDQVWHRPKVRMLDRSEARAMLAHLTPAQH
jgi:hypothetical protein